MHYLVKTPIFVSKVQTSESLSSNTETAIETLSQLRAEKGELQLQLDLLTQQSQLQLQTLKTEKLEFELQVQAMKENAKSVETPQTIASHEDKSEEKGELIHKSQSVDITHHLEVTIKQVYETLQKASYTHSGLLSDFGGLAKEDLVKTYSKEDSENVSGIIDENCRLKLALLQLEEQRQQQQLQQEEQLKQLKENQLQSIPQLKADQEQVPASNEVSMSQNEPIVDKLQLQKEEQVLQLQSRDNQLQDENQVNQLQNQLQEQLNILQQELQKQQDENKQLKEQLQLSQVQKPDQEREQLEKEAKDTVGISIIRRLLI